MSKRDGADKKPHPGIQRMVAHPGPTVASEGVTWRLGFNDQDAKGELEELIRAYVLRDALKNKRALGGKEGEDDYEATRAQIRRGHFHTFEKGWLDVVNSPVGAVLFLQSLLRRHHPDVTEGDARALLVREREQTEAAVEVVAPDFFKAMAVGKGLKPADAEKFAAAVVAGLGKPATSGTSSPPSAS